MKAQEKIKIEIMAHVKNRAVAQSLEFFHDGFWDAYATVPVRDHRESWPVKSKHFRLWVTQVLYDHLGAAPKALVNACLEMFETEAICKGPRHDVYVRLGLLGGAIYLDLANDRWQALEISPAGWTLVEESPLKFRRPVGMADLPCPYSLGEVTLREALARFLNVGPESEILLLAWLSFAFRADVPYPIVALSGVQGGGKSTITRILRALIDPSLAALTTTPRSERDLAIAATNGHLIAMDNLSIISVALSDAMCRVATGGSFRTRTSYTNTDETILTYRRPLVFNGIEELPVRPDLLDRSILIHVKPIPEERRRDETSFWDEFEAVRPQLFGALLDVVVAGLRNVDSVSLPSPPRMADFARWGVAVEQSLGYESGTFIRAYKANIEEAHAAALEASPIVHTLREYLRGAGGEFSGTALKLLQELTEFAKMRESGSQATVLKHPRFPKAGNQLSAEIARIEPNLAKLGITVERGRTHAGRYLRLRVGGADARHPIDTEEVPCSQAAAGA